MSKGARILVLLLAVFLAASGAVAPAEKKFNVVASFSVLGDMVKNVGGDRIEVTTLVGPNGDTHVYEPTPADAKAVAGADLVVVNGLGFEGWMDRLIRTSGYKGAVVVASKGVEPRKMTAEETTEPGAPRLVTDPHAWQDLHNGQLYVRNIAAGLAKLDPAGASVYEANAKAYAARLGRTRPLGKAGILRHPQTETPDDHYPRRLRLFRRRLRRHHPLPRGFQHRERGFRRRHRPAYPTDP